MARRRGHASRPPRAVWGLTIKLAVTTGIVLAAWILYAITSALWFGSSPRAVAPYVYAPLLVAAGGWAGQRLARTVPPRLLALSLVLIAAWMLIGMILTSEPGKLPIGYANANAALAVQIVALAALVGLHPRARRLAWAGVLVGLLTVAANRSAAGLAVAIPLVLTSAFAAVAGPGRRRWPAALLSVSALTATTAGLVALSRRAAWPQAAIDAFDETRRFLWLQGWAAFRNAAVAGRGPGGYEELNKLTDPDQTSAHSLPLQVAVELGMIGLTLLVALYVAGLAFALRAGSPAQSWIAAAGWTALAIHAFVDHLVEYWPVMMAAGLVLGYGLVSQTPAEIQDEPVEVAGAGPGGS